MDHHEDGYRRPLRASLAQLSSSLPMLALICAYHVASSHLIGEGSTEATNLRGGRWLEWEDGQTADEEQQTLFPLEESDYLGFGLAAIALLIAAGGGMGGGGMLVPIYILVLEMAPKHAIPLSNVTVFGGAAANTLLNWRKRHPEADRPLIDWDLILIMEPLTIVGALLGSFLNILLPETILLVSLVALLGFTAFTTLKKAYQMYQKENLEFSKEFKADLIAGDEKKNKAKEIELKVGTNTSDNVSTLRKRSPTAASQGVASQSNGDGNVGVLMGHASQMDDHDTCSSSDDEKNQCVSSGLAFFETHENNRIFREKVLEGERTMPIKNILIVTVMFVVVLAINILKGGASFKSPLGIECGTASFWFANAALLGWITGVFFYGRRHLVQRSKLKERIKYPYLESDMVWDEQATLIFPGICCLAGFFAGMFGIGGGIVKGPLMIAMDVNPRVASASSACMIFMTTFTATSSYLVFGLLLKDYALVCFGIGFLATLIGNTAMSIVLKKQKRMSYIAFFMGGVVLLSVITMTVESVIHITSENHMEAVEGLCSASGH